MRQTYFSSKQTGQRSHGDGFRMTGAKNVPISGTKDTLTHPYLKRKFWANPRNQFWENGNYSEKSKEYFRKALLS